MQIRSSTFLSVILISLLLAGCATSYQPQKPQSIPLGQMVVILGEGWSRAPSAEVPEERGASRTYSQTDVSRDRMMVIPSVRDGEALFRGDSSLPAFSTDMNNRQIADLVAQSLQQTLWDGSATVAAKNVVAHGYLGKAGFMFDLQIDTSSGPDHEGLAGGFVEDKKLYVNVFTAEAPDHFEQTMDAGRRVIETATVRARTISVN